MGPGLQFDPGLQLHLELEVGSLPKLVGYFVHSQPQFLTQKPEIKTGSFYKSFALHNENLTFWGAESGNVIKCFHWHIDVEAGFQSLKYTIAETGMGVTSRP